MIRYVPVLILSVFALGASPQNYPPPPQHPVNTASTAATTTNERFATFVADKGFYCTLLLENLRQDVPITVTPALILEEGEIPLEPVTVPAHDTASVDISAFLTSHGYTDKRGTVSVRYNFKTYGPLDAVVESYNETTHVYLNSHGQSPQEYWAGNSFDAVVWAPDAGTKGFVSITNTSTSVRTVQVTASFKGKSEQLPPVVISPRTTHFLAIDDLVQQSHQDGVGIHVEFDGGWPGDIIVESQLFNERTGFAKNIHFADKALQYPTATLRTHFVLLGQQPVADGFPPQMSFRSVAAVRNIGSIPLNVTPTIKYLDGGVVQTIPLPLLPLPVGESAIIDLTAEQKSGRIPQGFHQGNIELFPDNAKGNMVAELFNFDEGTGGYVVGPSFSAYPNRGTASIWRTDGTYQTAITVENTAAADDQVMLKLFSDSGTYNKTYSVPQNGLLEINVKDLNAVPDEKGHVLSGTYGVYSISGSHGAQSKLTFGKIIYSADESDYVGYPPNSCDYVLGISLYFDFSGGANPFPVMADWDWAQSGVDTQPSYGAGVNASYITISNNQTGDMATVNFANAVPGQNLLLNGPATGATTCDACSASDIYPAGSQTMPVMPRILFGTSQTDITGTTQSVVVGQQIALTASYKIPSNLAVQNQNWDISGTGSNPPTAVGGFNQTQTSGGTFSPTVNGQSTTIYWVVPTAGNITDQVNFFLTLSDGNEYSATAQFTVAGPTSVQIAFVAEGQPNFLNNGTTNVTLDFGDPTATPGIQWTGTATSPPQVAGTYQWAQIIASNNWSYTVGTTTTSCNGPSGLDNVFPLPINSATFTDSPGRNLPSADNKFTWTWSATTYFMWNPGLTNSISVPIGQRVWEFFSDTTQNMTTHVWTVQSDSSTFAGAPQIGYFPIQWSSVAKNGNLGGCP